MRAYRFDALTSLDDLRLHEEAQPRPQRGELLLRVRAVSLNYRDVAIAQGTYPQPAKAGLVPGSDAACEVVDVGEGVDAYKPGDRVIGAFHPRWFGGPMPSTLAQHAYGSGQDGWLSEFKVVSQEAVVRLPDGLTFEEGATLPCAAATAWSTLSGPTPIRVGHSVLTLGTGGVSIFALQLAKALGARVIATTSSAAKADRLRALGADEVIDYSKDAAWGETARALSGGAGVDRVVEVGGAGTIAQSLRAVALGGEIVLVGFLTDNTAGIDYFQLFGSNAVVRSVGVGDRANLEACVKAVSQAGCKPVIDRVFAFNDAKAAFAHLRSGKHIGKVVISLA